MVATNQIDTEPIFPLFGLNRDNGFVIRGIDAWDLSGSSVSSAGDVNGDGIGDLIIGASSAGNFDVGESYVVFGSNGELESSLDLSNLDGSNGFAIDSLDDIRSRLGSSVSSAGDVNGDGFDDLIIGAPGADPNDYSSAGESYGD